MNTLKKKFYVGMRQCNRTALVHADYVGFFDKPAEFDTLGQATEYARRQAEVHRPKQFYIFEMVAVCYVPPPASPPVNTEYYG